MSIKTTVANLKVGQYFRVLDTDDVYYVVESREGLPGEAWLVCRHTLIAADQIGDLSEHSETEVVILDEEELTNHKAHDQFFYDVEAAVEEDR